MQSIFKTFRETSHNFLY